MNLIDRYLFREVTASCLLVLLVMFVILMSNQFAVVLGDAAGRELPREAVFIVFGLSALRYLSLLAPVAVFLGIMLALARLNRDSETAALNSCGIGPSEMMMPIGLMTLMVAAATAWLTLISAPASMRQIEAIRYEAREALELHAIEPGRFIQSDADNAVLYAERVEGEFVYGVFWSNEIDGRVVVIVAESGRRIEDPVTGALSFVLNNGTRTEGVPGQLDFSVMEFREHGLPIRMSDGSGFEESIEMLSVPRLLASGDPQASAEFQERIAAPLSLIILALLAVPLSRSSPREGRYARVGVGLLVYFIYANLLSVARVWVERDAVPGWLGMWWVHGSIAVVALVLFARDAGWFARPGRIVREGDAA